MVIKFEDIAKYQLIDTHKVKSFTLKVYLHVGGKGMAKNRIINVVTHGDEMVMMIGEKGKSFLIGLMESYDDI